MNSKGIFIARERIPAVSFLKTVMAAAVMFLLFSAFTCNSETSKVLSDMNTAQSQDSSGVSVVSPAILQSSYRNTVKKVLPVVVEVNVVDIVHVTIPDFSPFSFFFDQLPNGGGSGGSSGGEREYKQYGLGSGVIVRQTKDTAYVLTNNHVVGEAEEISIKLPDGREFKGSLVGNDEHKDLALVAFKTDKPVPVAELGDSSILEPGDVVLAIGNPLGFESTVTAGIVSAIGRKSDGGTDISTFTDYIQTDASINQGNSGGALVNLEGQVIGINTWIASPSGGNVGIGFAIPINNAKTAINDFITKGRIEYGWLGINIGEPVDGVADDMHLAGIKGAMVFDVFTGSPADKADIFPGDFITVIDGKQVSDSQELIFTVSKLTPGQTVALKLIRQGKEKLVEVEIASRGDEKSIKDKAANLWPGMTVVGLTDDIRKQLNLKGNIGNVVVGSVVMGSPADIAGFKGGDIIRTINKKPVASTADFYRLFADREREKVFTIYREGRELILGLVRQS
ncbi:MAG: Do family serine endopeptidase [Spirochaetales bacterium]|nr:Do family serine endopeptidase [Spirochaetales bacterium]